MKNIKPKILMVSVAILATISLNAQTAMTSQYNKTVDTVSNTGTKYMYSGRIAGVGSDGVLSATVKITKISGTVAGKVSLEGSNDGVNFYPIYAQVKTTVDSTYFNPTDVATQAYRFKVLNFADTYIRFNYTGAGTMSAKIESIWYYRKGD